MELWNFRGDFHIFGKYSSCTLLSLYFIIFSTLCPVFPFFSTCIFSISEIRITLLTLNVTLNITSPNPKHDLQTLSTFCTTSITQPLNVTHNPLKRLYSCGDPICRGDWTKLIPLSLSSIHSNTCSIHVVDIHSFKKQEAYSILLLVLGLQYLCARDHVLTREPDVS